jgi:hypothetical protein
MASIQWKGNSKLMVQTLIARSPQLYRKAVEESLIAAILHKAVNGVVTEETVLESIKVAAPKQFQHRAVKLVETLMQKYSVH